MATSEVVAGDLMQVTLREGGVVLIEVLVAISAVMSAKATNYALGRDLSVSGALGKWKKRTSSPVNAFLVQVAISLALVCLGFFTCNGFETIVEYTASVFWYFLLLVGIALFVLSRKDPNLERPFRVPLYPVLPLVCCLTSAYLFYSSLMYTGFGAMVGITV
ncbi:amino acid permease [Pontibacter burrus]|uniref:amino acid permease n=1 Tax=Pontibacter burrus TaxID=2704466 RepID=UPI001F3CEAB3|nr:amino acid permease [Pontibacter burrus]